MRLTILFGSQTGNAEEVSERIYREAKRQGFSPFLSAMDDFPLEEFGALNLAVFVCSTTGQGEEPDNMKRFWRFLRRKEIPGDALSQLQFGVFGLGDSSYPKYTLKLLIQRFNFPAKKLFKRIIQIGGNPIVERGDGDDQHPLGLDGGLDPWLDKLWNTLREKHPSVVPIDDIPNSLPVPSFTLDFDSHTSRNLAKAETASYRGFVTKNKRISAEDHFQDVRHIEIKPDIEVTRIYQPGDVLAIRPKNLADDVQEVIDYFEWNEIADKPFHLRLNDENRRIPITFTQYNTLRDLLTHSLDIFGRPKRFTFELLSHFAKDPDQKEKLAYFATAEGQDDLYAYCHRMGRTYFEVLQDFQSVRFPVDYLLDLIPEMRPRYFSISSSPLAHAPNLHLTVAIVRYKTKMVKQREGVCTKWMSTWKEGDEIEFSIKKGSMKLSVQGPAIFIGPGTGIAPLRSFLHQRAALSVTSNTLFFGCRNESKDFFFREEYEDMVNKGALCLHTAFSRDQPQKRYVQHVLLERSSDVFSLIENGAHIYLSGNAKNMPTQVEDALKEILRREGGMSEDDAEAYFMKVLVRTGRFQQECWS